MIIRELKPSQHVRGRWLAVLGDGSVLRVGEAELLDFALYAGRELEEAELACLRESARRTGLKGRALDALGRKPLSRRELERKLSDWGAEETECGEICARMEELGLLDDARYALTVVQHYAAKGYGERKLRDELYRRGVPRDLWDEALSQAGDTARALDAFLAKKLGAAPADPKQVKRASDALARRGYCWPEIRAALQRWGAEIEEE